MIKARIIVVDLRNGQVIREHDNVAWFSQGTAQWLGRMGVWAMRSGYGLQILDMHANEPATDPANPAKDETIRPQPSA